MSSLVARIRALSPLGPIFSKELRTTSRRKRTYWLRVVYLGLLLLGLLFCYLIFRQELNHDRGVAQRAQGLAIMGLVFFGVFSFFTLSAMALVGPVLTATAVNSERLHKTLGVLLMTPINTWQIAAGKLFSRLLIAMTLIGLSLPVLAVVRLLGGVELSSMFGSICICASTALFTASIGLFYSTLISRAYAVILLAYGTLALLWGILPGLIGGLVFGAMDVDDQFVALAMFRLFAVSNPFVQMGLTILPDAPFGGMWMPSWEWHSLVYTGLSALLLLCTAAILRKRARRDLEGASPAPAVIPWTPPPPAFPVIVPAATGDPALPPPLPPVVSATPWMPKPPREVSDNPVLWRETRRPLFPRLWQKITAAVVSVGLLLMFYLILAAGNDLDDEEPHIFLAGAFWVILTLLSTIVSAAAIAHEKESDTWTLLLATPISGMAIVMGKLAGLLRRLMWPAALMAGHFIVFTIFGVLHPISCLVCIWLTLTTCLLWLTTGVYWSLRLKNTTFAVILNLLCPLALYALLPLLVAIGGELTRDGSVPRLDPAEATLFANPMVYMGNCIDDLDSSRFDYGSHWSRGHRPRRQIHFMMNTVWSPGEFAVLSLAVGGIYVGASGMIAIATARRLDRIVGRAPQVDSLPPGLSQRPA